MSPNDVLQYWFGETPPATDEEARKRLKLWFGGGKEVDLEITERFGALVTRAAEGKLDDWANTDRGRLALILVLDQFTRNIHRGRPKAFALDSQAQRHALAALESGGDRELHVLERMFLAMPLVHAEKIDLQDRVVAYFTTLVKAAPPALHEITKLFLANAHEHRETIHKFGRFPARNHSLNRTSTGPEMAHLFQQKTPAV